MVDQYLNPVKPQLFCMTDELNIILCETAGPLEKLQSVFVHIILPSRIF